MRHHESVVRIGLEVDGVVVAAELVGPRQHQPADHLLDRPAILDELQGQVVEQFGMGGRLAVQAEVVERRG